MRIGDADPRPMQPPTVNLDADEYRIGDARVCPVCIKKAMHERGEIRFPSFYLMMRHWEAVHPDVAPADDRDHTKPYAEMRGVLMDLDTDGPTIGLEGWVNLQFEEKE